MAGKELFIENIEGKNEGWRKKFKSKRFKKKIISIKKSKFGAFSLSVKKTLLKRFFFRG